VSREAQGAVVVSSPHTHAHTHRQLLATPDKRQRQVDMSEKAVKASAHRRRLVARSAMSKEREKSIEATRSLIRKIPVALVARSPARVWESIQAHTHLASYD
jgi:hypothetical protein